MIDAIRLASIPLFGELDSHDLGFIAARVREVTVLAGEVIIEQGEMPEDIYVLEDGTVEISHDGVVVSTQGPGGVVGEIALVDPQRRTATVRATTDVRAVALSIDDFQAVATEMPEIARDLHAIATKRIAELDGRG
ncbi:MAG: family transcriptional regulator, cyclic receptor protein [Actinomycetota bacterium]|jgi:CRP-like cAMP-binding protein|nr:family transcriptional regulator, cyclic receptor protein [Actinomycetota bacterium]MEA2579394.1 family transcriptional regulator, cyclic receptor protein [Actinomycetota bacterium]